MIVRVASHLAGAVRNGSQRQRTRSRLRTQRSSGSTAPAAGRQDHLDSRDAATGAVRCDGLAPEALLWTRDPEHGAAASIDDLEQIA